jgi:polyferredoxin
VRAPSNKALFSKRGLIQAAALVVPNLYVPGFINGTVYSGSLKTLCAPGLNCYACPGAVLACPIGALQAGFASPSQRISLYVIGFLVAVGLVCGRFVCGFLCPFGLIQEIVHKPASMLAKRSPRIAKLLGRTRHLPRPLRAGKYIVLAVLVIALPLLALDAFGYGQPWFCMYLCPSGIIMGALPLLPGQPQLQNIIGGLFYFKLAIATAILLAVLLNERFFCKTLCPLGAIYGMCNRFSLLQLQYTADKCVACGACASTCPMELDPTLTQTSAECIRCGRCITSCDQCALHMGFREQPQVVLQTDRRGDF